MSILEHIGELRSRLLKSCVALLVATVAAFALLYEPVIDFLLRSYCALPASARIGSVAEDGGCRLAALSPLEPLSIRIRVSLTVGLLLAMPFVAYQLWRFITPGLKPNEKRFAIPFALASTLLFVAGLAAWVVIVVQARIRPADLSSLLRGWRPFTALLIGAAVPKLLFLGPSLLGGLPLALLSGIFQQVALQVGLTDRLEAVLRSPGAGAVAAALLFGFAHTPIDLAKADGDVLLALSSAVCLQAQIGLVFCIAHIRHRAPVALGVAHAIVIA
jgi:hypothetical protein